MNAPALPELGDVHEDSDANIRGRRLAEVFLSLSTLLAVVGLAISLLGVVGWALDLRGLRQLHASLPEMHPNTAVGLVIASLAVLSLRNNQYERSVVRSRIVCSLAVIVLLLGLLTLGQYVFGWDFGLDRILSPAPPTPIDPYLGSSPQAAVNFALLGACLLLFELSPQRSFRAAQIAVVFVAANAVAVLTGYIFGVRAFYRFSLEVALAGMSAPAALAFIMLSLSLLCSRPNEGIMNLIASASQSGAIARRIVLILIVGPPLVGVLTLMGVSAGWYDLSVQATLFVLIMLGLLLWTTWQAARQGWQSELLTQTANAETRRARDQFEELARRVHTLLEHAPDGVFVADLAGRYTEVNGAGCRMLGYSREEILDKAITDVIAPEEARRLAQLRDTLFRGDAQVEEWRLRRKDGTYFPAEISTNILPDGRWQAFVRDISERKRIERELRFSEAKFSGIVSISADAIILIDRVQTIVMFNQGAERVFAYSAQEVLGRPLDILIPERFRTGHRSHIERFADGPDASRSVAGRDGPVYGLRKDGHEFPADAAISKLTIEHEKVLAIALRDISEQKRAEADHKFLAEAAAELVSTRDYEDTLESIASLAVRGIADVCIIDIMGADGKAFRRKVASRHPSRTQACNVLARAPADTAYLRSTVLKKKRPTLLRELSPEIATSLARSEAALEAWRELEPMSLVSIPLAAEGGVVAVLTLMSSTPWIFQEKDLSLADDFAYRAATAIENALLYRDLKQAIRAREDVLAIVSHDLRNPLTAIKTIAGLLRSIDLAKSDKLEKYTSAIQTSADQMKHLIEDLLDFSRMQSGGFTIKKQAEQPLDLITAAVDSMRSQAEARRQTLSVEGAGGLPELSCDGQRIGQALLNLLGNAMKFTPEGGAIAVSARVLGGELVMTVSDTGPGIPAEHLARIFDRYWQGEETRSAGAGLGLAIVKGIAEAHGGRTWAESQLGAGSSFHLALPLDQPH